MSRTLALAADRLAACLAAPSPKDGRKWVFAFLAGCMFILAVAHFTGRSSRMWRLFGVESMTQSFGDMRIITGSWESYRQGLDPLWENPGDPWKRSLNYPRLWLLPARTGLGTRDTVAISLAVIAAFYLCAVALIRRATPAQAVPWILLLCSPATMLAIERCNNDLIVFVLLVVAVFLFRISRWAGYGLIFLAAVLKLYPVCCFAAVARETRRVALLIIGLAGLGFGLYLLGTWTDVVQVFKVSPRPLFWGYGATVFATIINTSLQFRGYAPQRIIPAVSFLGAVMLGAASIAWGQRARAKYREGTATALEGSRDQDLFRVGSSVYVATFLIGANFHYRLIALLLCVPSLLAWISGARWIYRTALLALLCAILSAWEPWLLVHAWRARHFIALGNELVTWSLFALLLALLACTSPDWLVEHLAWLRFDKVTDKVADKGAPKESKLQ